MRTRMFVAALVAGAAIAPAIAQTKTPAAPAAVPAPGATPAKKASTAVPAKKAYVVPRTPWGDPDLQGIYQANDNHGVPFERPANAEGKTEVTPQEADARRERATQASIWGYDREWRDTAPGFVKTDASRQVAMVLEADGRVPPLTPAGQARAAERARAGVGFVEGSNEDIRADLWVTDLSPWVRCITRGYPEMWIPQPYNNGIQIVQGPGYVVIEHEMVHEARVIPIDRTATALGPKLTQWLGAPRGHWDGDTLVVEIGNFNGSATFRGATGNLKLTERYTRTDRKTIQYRAIVDDPDTWVRPWTFGFDIKRDDEQYELVEYACHEGNYAATNILKGARAKEAAATPAAKATASPAPTAK